MSKSRTNNVNNIETFSDCKQVYKFFKTITKEECRQTPVNGSTTSSYNRLHEVNDIEGHVSSDYLHRDKSYPFDDHEEACKDVSRKLVEIAEKCIQLSHTTVRKK